MAHEDHHRGGKDGLLQLGQVYPGVRGGDLVDRHVLTTPVRLYRYLLTYENRASHPGEAERSLVTSLRYWYGNDWQESQAAKT